MRRIRGGRAHSGKENLNAQVPNPKQEEKADSRRKAPNTAFGAFCFSAFPPLFGIWSLSFAISPTAAEISAFPRRVGIFGRAARFTPLVHLRPGGSREGTAAAG